MANEIANSIFRFFGLNAQSPAPRSAPPSPPAAPAPAEPKADVEPKAPGLARLPQLVEDIGKGAAWTYAFVDDSAPLEPSQRYVCALAKVDSFVCLQVSAGDPKAPSGGATGGYNIRVTDELEAAASSHPIVIKIVARAMEPASTRLGCAYSTNEVGNSGWMWRTIGPEWAAHEFEYKVPKMKDGRGDFLGLLPSPQGEPGAEIAALAIHILT